MTIFFRGICVPYQPRSHYLGLRFSLWIGVLLHVLVIERSSTSWLPLFHFLRWFFYWNKVKLITKFLDSQTCKTFYIITHIYKILQDWITQLNNFTMWSLSLGIITTTCGHSTCFPRDLVLFFNWKLYSPNLEKCVNICLF